MSTLASATPTLDFKLPIEGMTCASCVLRVEKALESGLALGRSGPRPDEVVAQLAHLLVARGAAARSARG